ncbi:MAG: class I SAM-dependent methyltransferase [Bacteroidales bacterium]|nr:class I SAM-dependent methyltransferase [Bacteroidales bacterium]
MKVNLESIDKQFRHNKGKNLFYDGVLNSLGFIPETLDAIEGIDLIDKESEELLINYLTDRAIREFCAINQYFSFDQQAHKQLRALYSELFSTVKMKKLPVESIARKHYENLIIWLQNTNSFAVDIYESKGESIDSVACSEYSPELQMEILQLDLDQIMEPVLDIGCGVKAGLVLYLRSQGIEAFGIDRFAEEDTMLQKSDWLDFRYEKDSWGTICSNLGFSNHFHHHHLRQDGSFIDYARKYMEILASLKPGGSFHYAPDLPFVEQFLDNGKYLLSRQSIREFEFKSTVIKRLL